MSIEHSIQSYLPGAATHGSAHMPPKHATAKPDWVSAIPGLASVLLAPTGGDGSPSPSGADTPALRLVQQDAESMGSFGRRVARCVRILGRNHPAFQRMGVLVQDYFPAGSSARAELIASIVLRLGSSPVPLTVRFVGVMEADRG